MTGIKITLKWKCIQQWLHCNSGFLADINTGTLLNREELTANHDQSLYSTWEKPMIFLNVYREVSVKILNANLSHTVRLLPCYG